MHNHYIQQNGEIYYLLSINKPHRIWYPMNIASTILSDEYIKEKYGITSPRQLTEMSGEFNMAIANKDKAELLASATSVIYYNGIEYPFYLLEKSEKSVLIYIEKGLFTLYPKDYEIESKAALGYPWAVINKTDPPDYISWKLYDDRPFFGYVLREEIWNILNW